MAVTEDRTSRNDMLLKQTDDIVHLLVFDAVDNLDSRLAAIDTEHPSDCQGRPFAIKSSMVNF